jgi:hypothetical protein
MRMIRFSTGNRHFTKLCQGEKRREGQVKSEWRSSVLVSKDRLKLSEDEGAIGNFTTTSLNAVMKGASRHVICPVTSSDSSTKILKKTDQKKGDSLKDTPSQWVFLDRRSLWFFQFPFDLIFIAKQDHNSMWPVVRRNSILSRSGV